MNRLSSERSPYLLQHANNPVNWFPWGEEAFAEARRAEKPIFLSIGYSTCHWCHVMERESFEDAGIADVLNREFVSIKVDREERPDVDRVYMTFVQATTGAGGWPMSVWLTPELKPFAGGTYFPPSSRWGRPGFVDVLMQIAKAWRDDRSRVMTSAEAMTERLKEATGAGGSAPDRAPVADRPAIDLGIDDFAKAFDSRHGGFGGAPKFPRPSELLFLLEGWAFTGDDRARRMALDTLRAMALGGVRDHIGGGFHRYSVDAEWRVPHFEKMLYDQAQLVMGYLEGAQASGEDFYAAVAEDTLEYVRRDLTSPEGMFYSAEDADSLTTGGESGHGAAGDHPELVEGAFYVFTGAEIDALTGVDAPIVRRRFGVEDSGNALADPQGEFRGQNILYVAQEIGDIAMRVGRSVEDVMAALVAARTTLFQQRAKRPRPHLDDKVIASWNGMMIAAFARAARVLVDSPRRNEWRDIALRAGTALRQHLWRSDEKRLLRRYRGGDAAIPAFCEDYACVAWSAIELFQISADPAWLEWALELTTSQIALFSDDMDGGWFSTTGKDESVLLRLKEDYDGAEPAAASVTVRNLITLAHITGDHALRDRAGRTLERYGPQLGRVARVMPLMLANVTLWRGRFAQIVLTAPEDSSGLTDLERVVARTLIPWSVTIPVLDDTRAGALAAKWPWLGATRPVAGRATAYVCYDFTCQAPATDAAELQAQLAAVGGSQRILRV